MSLADEYKRKIKKPLIKVKIRKTFGNPSIDPITYLEYIPEITNCEIGKGFDQDVSDVVVTIIPPYDVNGDYVIFSPMDNVIIEQGWNKQSTMKTAFYGFIDSVNLTNFPKQEVLNCSDVLKLAQNNFYTDDNKKSYTSSGWVYAEELISEFLVDSGIPVEWQDLDYVTVSGCQVSGERFKVGYGSDEDSPVEFVNVNAINAIKDVCDTAGYRIWAANDGIVRLRYVRPMASSEAALTYRRSNESFSGGVLIEDEELLVDGGYLLSYSHSATDEKLRNWIDVVGHADASGIQITSSVAGLSDYIPSGVTYRRAEYDSYLVDTQEMADWTAVYIYNDLNRLVYEASIVIEGDPRCEIGQTVSIIDGDFTYWYDDIAASGHEDRKYFLYDVQNRHSANEWKTVLGLTGGTGPGAPAFQNMSPVAAFDVSVEVEYF